MRPKFWKETEWGITLHNMFRTIWLYQNLIPAKWELELSH